MSSITASRRESRRGVPHITPELCHTIEESYVPQCTTLGALAQVRRARAADGALFQDLKRSGCVPFRRGSTAAGPSW